MILKISSLSKQHPNIFYRQNKNILIRSELNDQPLIITMVFMSATVQDVFFFLIINTDTEITGPKASVFVPHHASLQELIIVFPTRDEISCAS